jgi:2-methylcitrate dehydratase PrpD
MSITERLARFAIESGSGILTAEVAASAKLKFLDTIAVMLKGARHPSGTIAHRLAQRMGGNPAATLFVDGGKASAPLSRARTTAGGGTSALASPTLSAASAAIACG